MGPGRATRNRLVREKSALANWTPSVHSNPSTGTIKGQCWARSTTSLVMSPVMSTSTGFVIRGQYARLSVTMQDQENISKTKRATLDLWPDTGQILGLGRNATYDAAGRGEIPTIRIGRRLLVPRAALERMLSAQV